MRQCRERTDAIRIEQTPPAFARLATTSLHNRKRLPLPAGQQRHRALQHQPLEVRRLLMIAERLLALILLIEQKIVIILPLLRRRHKRRADAFLWVRGANFKMTNQSSHRRICVDLIRSPHDNAGEPMTPSRAG